MSVEKTKDVGLAEVSPTFKNLSFDEFKTFLESAGFYGDFETAYKKIGGVIEKKTTKKDVEH
jgi:hypothetical protein